MVGVFHYLLKLGVDGDVKGIKVEPMVLKISNSTSTVSH
jgi:hypothetical protein